MNTLQPAALAKYIDHTLLAPDASREQIRTLCEEAREHGFYSVCVNSGQVPYAASISPAPAAIARWASNALVSLKPAPSGKPTTAQITTLLSVRHDAA